MESPQGKKLGRPDVQSWDRRNVRTRLVCEMLRLGVRGVFAAETADLSLLHFLFYSHSGGSLDSLFNVKEGAQEQRVVGGLSSLPTGWPTNSATR